MSNRKNFELGRVPNEREVPPLNRDTIELMAAAAVREIQRQELLARSGKFGGVHVLPSGPDHARLPVLMEELGEVARELNEALITGTNRRRNLQEELLQLAACAIAWAAAIDIGEGRA